MLNSNSWFTTFEKGEGSKNAENYCWYYSTFPPPSCQYAHTDVVLYTHIQVIQGAVSVIPLVKRSTFLYTLIREDDMCRI